ncbi:MAG: tetratricopeptide repeat protein, partial [Wenzhouxiangella sp.]|nr:tetratricopeptide repeat protein [Wenzhouxiangella sp.]
ATAWGELGERERAEAISRETLARRERVLGRDHPETINTRNNLAAVLIQRGALDEAEPLARSVVDWNVARLGPLHPNSLTARNILAYLLEDRGAVAEAEALYRTILAEVHARGDDALNAQVLGVANNLGMLLLNNDQAAAAADVFAALLPESERLLGHSHPNHAIFVGNHGWCLVRLGRPGEGAELMRASVELLEPVLGPEHPRMLQLAARIAEAEVLALERPVGNP